jgi:hypothetical protein
VNGAPEPAADVVSIARRPGYQADYRGLACAQVRSAREKLGLSVDEFAEHLTDQLGWKVDAVVVSRWEQSAVPPGDVVLAAAVTAQGMPGDVLALPLTETAGRRAAMMSAIEPALHSGEAVTPYADRGLITREQWNGIIRGANSHLWLYGMAEFGYATDDEVPAIVGDTAAAGGEVRVLLLSPDYADIDDIDTSEGSPPGTLESRIRAALARFSEMREACGGRLELRVYDTHPTVSVVRGDSEMLVTPYLRYFIGSNSPTIGLSEGSAPKMFGRYARHFQHMWDLAKEWTR